MKAVFIFFVFLVVGLNLFASAFQLFHYYAIGEISTFKLILYIVLFLAFVSIIRFAIRKLKKIKISIQQQ